MVRSNLHKRKNRWVNCARLVVCALMTFVFVIGIFGGVVRAANSAMDDASSSTRFLTLAQYENELDRLANAFSDLPEHASGAEALRQSLPTKWIVDTGQEKYEVSAVWIADALKVNGKSAKEQKDIWEGAAARLK